MTYDLSLENDIRHAFEKKGEKWLSNTVYNMKKAEKQSLLMGDAIWEWFCENWLFVEAKKTSATNSKNQNSSMGGSLYTGGSCSLTYYEKK